ncbi:MAG: amino acid--tRNA ligase-related protein [Alphaproteobacteria bacterium]
MAQAFRDRAGIDLLATLCPGGTGDGRVLSEAARKAGIRVAPDDTWSDVFSRVLVERIEPFLGDGRHTLLCEYPAPEAALARRCAHDPRVSERFELYACGVELANAFGELTDPVEQRRRLEGEMDEKVRIYGERYPLDEDFLAALAHMPEASGAAYEVLMEDCATLLAVAAEAAGTGRLRWREREADPFAEPERLTVAQAFERYAGVDLFGEDLAAQARVRGIRVAVDDTWADVFSRIMVEKVEPNLGQGRATILCEYPVSEAALARPKPGDPRVSERFELYACGVELANCFGELTDPVEQRARFEIEMAEKARLYGERYPIDEDFLAALAIMPPASGGAMGFDRLVMLATGARRIEQVLWTPVA